MSNETELGNQILTLINQIKNDNDSNEWNNRATLILQCITVVFVMIKPILYYWIDAKYKPNKKREKDDSIPGTLPLDNLDSQHADKENDIESQQSTAKMTGNQTANTFNINVSAPLMPIDAKNKNNDDECVNSPRPLSNKESENKKSYDNDDSTSNGV